MSTQPPPAPATLSPTQRLLSLSRPISQGAEAILLLSPPHPLTPILLKHRFPKQYRHPTLDAQLTRTRVQAEARALVRAARAGVRVPGVRCVDLREGVVGVEWIDGPSVRAWLQESEGDGEGGREGEKGEVMRLIGEQVGRLHKAEIIHGDLTTSNMLLRPLPSPSPAHEVVMIDFGLSFTSSLAEDRAVDLYVLERAFASTHPDAEGLFGRVLEGYGAEMGRAWEGVGKRLDEVRLRGRKRSMVG